CARDAWGAGFDYW
nr:immunoglobulin heavy chain junction region [Macaca mulatta]MOV36042.1 immunoglobulin heavy chain junction region [Macaca mulatta]MOV36209.1 immunoglobulin heavy chain junction region [Macaca mulatta]MOV36215.1 immunoglobulin heavy chain junction region [Macaca mulatta]MOV36374.1 immunoglobulin heavy chain junction region [Macaca mulatta]